ncbi:Centriolin, partial [Opisthocomus hoazin]
FRCQNSADVLGKSLANLQKEFNDILADAKREKEEAWARQRQLQEEMVSQQEKLEEVEENYRQASENRQNKNKVDQLENEIQHLHEKIKSMEEIQGLADQQLQEANEEKKTILAQLEDLEKR